MAESSREGLLSYVFSGVTIQATDLERSHKPGIVRLVDDDEIISHLAALFGWDDDSLYHRGENSADPDRYPLGVGLAGAAQACTAMASVPEPSAFACSRTFPSPDRASTLA